MALECKLRKFNEGFGFESSSEHTAAIKLLRRAYRSFECHNA